MKKAAIVLAWIASGLLGAGVLNADMQASDAAWGKCDRLTTEFSERDFRISMMTAAVGPIGLLASIFATDGAYHGISFEKACPKDRPTP